MAKSKKKTFRKSTPPKVQVVGKKKNSPATSHGQPAESAGFWQKGMEIWRRNGVYVLIPAILAMILLLLFIVDGQIGSLLKHDIAKPEPFAFTPQAYPVYMGVQNIPITAKAAVVMEVPSHKILYVKNQTLRFSMASTTKIMTALTALSYYSLSSVVTVQTPHVEGSIIGLKPGEQFTVENLLYAMFLPSANDAAYTLADNYPGGRQAFVTQMNKNAKKYHLTNTHYTDPAGLEDDGDFTTITDLAHLTAIALQNPIIARIVDTKNYVITDTTGVHTFKLQNLNQLLGYQGVNGVKTGTTEGAGEVLITSQKAGNHTYIYIVMQSQNRFQDTLTLINNLSGSVSYISPLK